MERKPSARPAGHDAPRERAAAARRVERRLQRGRDGAAAVVLVLVVGAGLVGLVVAAAAARGVGTRRRARGMAVAAAVARGACVRVRVLGQWRRWPCEAHFENVVPAPLGVLEELHLLWAVERSNKRSRGTTGGERSNGAKTTTRQVVSMSHIT